MRRADGLMRPVLAAVVFAAMAGGCAVLLGREEIRIEDELVLEGDASAPDGASEQETASPAMPDASTDATGAAIDADGSGPICTAVDLECEAGPECCPDTECRGGFCRACLAEDASCGGGPRCCGTMKCNQANRCVPCTLEGGACGIINTLCCSGSCDISTSTCR